jgi:uncharacterized protein with FMN-binding domain
MRRISLWVLSTVSVIVLLFGYHTSTAGPLATSAPSSLESGASSGTVSSGSSGSSSGSSSTSTSSGSTVTGSVAQTQWGPVQVQLSVSGGKITKVDVVQYPSGNGKDQEINSFALPILTKETVDAQSADIDMVSGATVTSDGYLESLQSAIDKAGL